MKEKKKPKKQEGADRERKKREEISSRLKKYCQNENVGKNETELDKTRRKDEGQKRWERKGGDISRCAGREGGKGNLFCRGTEQNVTQAKNRGRGRKAGEKIYITGEQKDSLKSGAGGDRQTNLTWRLIHLMLSLTGEFTAGSKANES